MTPKHIKLTASVTGWAILCVIALSVKFVEILFSGLIYFMAASLLCFQSQIWASQCLRKSRRGGNEVLALNRRADAALLLGAQLAAIGVLNALSTIAQMSATTLLLSCFMVIIFFMSAYRLVSMADRRPKMADIYH